MLSKPADKSSVEKFTVVFLTDSEKPTKLVLLKRASWKKFAPNLYTGIGGHNEEGETAEESAGRELKEETGIENLRLNHFARCFVGRERIIDYFWAIFDKKLPECNEGTLEWVKLDKLFEKPIIEATQIILGEWKRRNFNLVQKWSAYLSYTKPDNKEWSGRKLEKIVTGIN